MNTPVHSSSSSTWKGYSYGDEESMLKEPMFCKCGLHLPLVTSWMKNNPGRRFRACPNYGWTCLQMIRGKKSALGNMEVAGCNTFRNRFLNFRVHLMKLNVLELFLDCLTEPNERLVEFGVGGICNFCADPTNVAVVIQCGGIPLVIQCLSSPVTNTVNYALAALYYLCNASTEEEILKPEVIEVIKKFAAAGEVNVMFSNLAQAFLDEYSTKLE